MSAYGGKKMKKDKAKIKIKRTKWDLSVLFKGDDDKEIELEKKRIEKENKKFVKKWQNRSDYLKNPSILKIALDEYELLQRKYSSEGKLGIYFFLRSSQDQGDPKIKAKLNNLIDFSSKIENNIKFFELNISKIPLDIQKKLLKSNILKEYKHYLEILFKKGKYLLSEKEEKIINLKSSSAHYNWVKMIDDFLSKEERVVLSENGKKEKKNFSEIYSLANYSQNKKVRDSATDAFNDILEKNSAVAEVEINSIFRNKKIDDELRGFKRAEESRHLEDDIDSKIVDTLADVVSSNFKISKDFYKLKANLLGFKKLKYNERNLGYGKINKKYSYSNSINLVGNSFKKLSEDVFYPIFKKFIENNQIDVYPKKGKTDGAFCICDSLSHPAFILLNHTGDIKNITTLAHEVGHGINFELMKRNQNSLNFDLLLSTGEVASTFMEDFVLDRILEETDDELRLAIYMEKLNSDISTIFRQIACYNFEKELHQKQREAGYLSKNEIGLLFKKHMSSYMGLSVEQSSGSQNWWVYWGHIRRFFYNYSYANGLLISKFLQKRVKENPEFISKVIKFLGAGTSQSPKDIFKGLGIDISKESFWQEGIGEVRSLLSETRRLAKKLGKI